MNVYIDWSFVFGVILVAAGPIVLYKSGVSLPFDYKGSSVSKALHLFTSFINIVIYICLATVYSKDPNYKGTIELTYLILLLVIGVFYFSLWILFSRTYNKKSIANKISELNSLEHLMSLASEQSKESEEKLKKLLSFLSAYKFLVISSLILYLAFFMLSAICIIRSGFF
jgi:hypothetical protein